VVHKHFQQLVPCCEILFDAGALSIGKPVNRASKKSFSNTLVISYFSGVGLIISFRDRRYVFSTALSTGPPHWNWPRSGDDTSFMTVPGSHVSSSSCHCSFHPISPLGYGIRSVLGHGLLGGGNVYCSSTCLASMT
jgi:hypothetical protein